MHCARFNSQPSLSPSPFAALVQRQSPPLAANGLLSTPVSTACICAIHPGNQTSKPWLRALFQGKLPPATPARRCCASSLCLNNHAPLRRERPPPTARCIAPILPLPQLHTDRHPRPRNPDATECKAALCSPCNPQPWSIPTDSLPIFAEIRATAGALCQVCTPSLPFACFCKHRR